MENLENGLDIIKISDYGDALRNSGYKSIESAMAEPVDNSIQANAKNIFIIIKDKVPVWGRKNQVYEIAFLDDGDGMDAALVQGCLRFGNGTHRNERGGIGKFGVGLPQSSMYACPRVEVYSWQNGVENCNMSYLDIEKVSNGEQTKIPAAERVDFPEEYKKYLKKPYRLFDKEFDFTVKGTLILWKTCDNVEPRTATALFNRLEDSFGRIYRYLLSDNTVQIFLIHDSKSQFNKIIKPNDPLFLMENNRVLGNPKYPEELGKDCSGESYEPLFEPWNTEGCPNGIIEKEIKYFDKTDKQIKVGKVTLKFSIVKEKFYGIDAITGPNPGSTPMGEYVGKLEGISVIREKREIDFGYFDFYSDKNSPFHRWWGCEISFGRDLDSVFKVSNNKQHVELIALRGEDYEEEDVKPVWLQLEHDIVSTISNMVKRNKTLRKGSRSKIDTTSPAEETATKSEEEEGLNIITETDEVRATKSEEELNEAVTNILNERGVENPDEEEKQKILRLKVIIKEQEANGITPYLFTFSVDTGLCICTIYTDHVYYENFISKMDDFGKNAFKLLIASFIKTIDESGPEKRKQYKSLMNDWNYKMNKYISTYLGLDS